MAPLCLVHVLTERKKDGCHWGFSQTLIFFQIDFLLGIWGKANIVQLGHMKKRAQISKIKKYLKILLKH